MKSTLNANNIVYADAMKAALNAVYQLDDIGCCVLRICFESRKPVISITPPPPDCTALNGAVRMWKTTGKTVQSVMSARFHDVQVEWVVCSQHAPGAWAGAYAHA
jgi:hypothetical protein